MIYVSASRGFKSGTANVSRYYDPPALPETLDAYEAGVKTELFSGRVRWNNAFFYYDHKNIQLTQQLNGQSILVNAKKGVAYGGETEFVITPVEGLTLDASVAYVHGRYKDFPAAPNTIPNPVPPGGNGNPVGVVNAAGFNYVQTPAITVNLGADYSVPTEYGTFDFNVLYYFNSGFFWEANNRMRQPSYNIVNLGTSWTAPTGKWDIRFWVNNVGNTIYASMGSSSPTGDQISDSDPRTYGVTLGMHL